MKTVAVYTLLALALTLNLVSAGEDVRTWRSEKGTEIRASFIKVRNGYVYLAKDGGEKKIPITGLSAKDQAYVNDLLATEKEAESTSKPAQEPVSADVRALFGNDLVTASGSKVNVNELGGKTIALYFSASWCPPCRSFTPKLVSAYNQLKAEGKPFEVVLIPSDRSDSAMRGYMKKYKMKWPAVKLGSDSYNKMSKYGVRGIPSLIVIDPEGKTVSKNGIGQVRSKGAASFSLWRK